MTAHAAAGTARVVNHCGTQLYIASVKNNNGARMQPLAASGSYSEPIVASNNGVAIKVARSASGPVVQFEYTLGTNGQLSYDTSNIDGSPFAHYGTRLVPGVGKSTAFPTCVAVDCPPGAYCDAAYNLPDDVRTMVCPGSADLVFTVCSGAKIDGGGGGSTGSGSGSAANGAAAPPAAGFAWTSFSCAGYEVKYLSQAIDRVSTEMTQMIEEDKMEVMDLDKGSGLEQRLEEKEWEKAAFEGILEVLKRRE